MHIEDSMKNILNEGMLHIQLIKLSLSFETTNSHSDP